ncbi:MAG: Fic family protein [Flavobacteriaceae bacterium]|nr:Fic family protein [Flavobacteriaceae bacterium]
MRDDEKKFLVALQDYRQSLRRALRASQNVLCSLIEHITAIEGSRLTRLEVQEVIQERTRFDYPEKDKRMVRDYTSGLFYVMFLYRNRLPLTIERIERLNHLVMRHNGEVTYDEEDHMIDTRKGKIREVSVYWEYHKFIDHSKIHETLEPLLRITNEQLSQKQSVLNSHRIAFDLHGKFLGIHPFFDGNSRTSRLLQNYVQGWYRQPLSTVRFENASIYKDTLLRSWEEEDPHIFNNYMFGQTIDFFRMVEKEYHIGKQYQKIEIKPLIATKQYRLSSKIQQ